jgi:hypothetical protein
MTVMLWLSIAKTKMLSDEVFISNVGDAQLASIHNTLLNVMLYRDGGFSSQSPAAVSFGVQLYCPISVSVLSLESVKWQHVPMPLSKIFVMIVGPKFGCTSS